MGRERERKEDKPFSPKNSKRLRIPKILQFSLARNDVSYNFQNKAGVILYAVYFIRKVAL